jgi:hypothetical protein
MFCNSLRNKGVGALGRIRTSNISVNSRGGQKSKCRVWCRLHKTRTHSSLFSCTQSCPQSVLLAKNLRLPSGALFKKTSECSRAIARSMIDFVLSSNQTGLWPASGDASDIAFSISKMFRQRTPGQKPDLPGSLECGALRCNRGKHLVPVFHK